MQPTGDLGPRQLHYVPEMNDTLPVNDGARTTNGTPRFTALLFDSAQSRADPPANADALLFGDPGGKRDHEFPSGTGGPEMLFGKTYELDALRCEPFDVLEGFRYTLTRKAVERPDQNKVEPALGNTPEHAAEFGTVCLAAAFVIDELLDDFPALPVGELA